MIISCSTIFTTSSLHYFIIATEKQQPAEMSGSRRDREELGGEDPDDEENVQYGVRRSRRTTSREHRPSSTLTPAQIMEQEVYYESAEEALERSLILAQIIGLLLIMYNHLNRMVG